MFTVDELPQNAYGEVCYRVVDENGFPFAGLRYQVKRHAELTCAQLNWTARCMERGYLPSSSELPQEFKQHGLQTLRPEDRHKPELPAEACCDVEHEVEQSEPRRLPQ